MSKNNFKTGEMVKELEDFAEALKSCKESLNFKIKEDKRLIAVYTGCINRIYKIIDKQQPTTSEM